MHDSKQQQNIREKISDKSFSKQSQNKNQQEKKAENSLQFVTLLSFKLGVTTSKFHFIFFLFEIFNKILWHNYEKKTRERGREGKNATQVKWSLIW